MSESPCWKLDFTLRNGRGLSLEAQLSEPSLSLGLSGASGAGKTSLVRVLAGVELRAQGVVEVQGQRWLDTNAGFRVPPWERGVGWVPQDAALFPHLSVCENLLYARRGERGEGALERVAEALEITPLLDRQPRLLSGGERQRVALGRALLSHPKVLFLDEPFSALDRPLRRRVLSAVRELVRAQPVPLLLVSHDAEDQAALCERHHVVEGGRLRPVD